jgi:DNA-binding transcriptional LysR family regulator
VKHDLMNLRKLRHVVALANHGSYVAAARELNLSPSALSRSIQSLEEEMNLVLFTRGKGGVFATPAGTRVINAAHGLIENLTQLQESLGNLAHGELGETAIGVAPLPAAIVLAQLFERTLAERKLRIQVQVEAGARLLELLNSGRIEFFVGTAGSIGRAPNITIEPLVVISIAARVRKDHPLAQKAGITRTEFASFPLVGGNFEANARLGVQPLRPYNPIISCDNYHILADAVRTSDAICPFPVQLETPGLVDLDCAPGVYREDAPLILCKLRSRRLSKPATALLQGLRQVMHELGPPVDGKAITP